LEKKRCAKQRAHPTELMDFVDRVSRITIAIGELKGKAIRFDNKEKICIVCNGYITVP